MKKRDRGKFWTKNQDCPSKSGTVGGSDYNSCVSAHVHKVPGRDRQTYAHIVVLRPAMFTNKYAAIAIYDADAKCTQG